MFQANISKSKIRWFLVAFVLWALILWSCKTVEERKYKEVLASDRQEYDSKVPAKVAMESIPGIIYYKTYKLESQSVPVRKVRTCYLQHGYGIDQSIVSFKRLTFDNFVHTYYSIEAINKLLQTVCGEVIVALQESNQTTILEMTRRTENFLKDVVCKPDENGLNLKYDKTCAYIGHSKGGAVAFNIARRCMSKTSELEEQGCKRLGEIYSATGVIQGAMATMAVYGAYLSKDKEEEEAFVKVLGFGMNMLLPLYEDYQPEKTNPTWVDLSPGAPMENGIPLYVINDIALQKTGWLTADFAASGVTYLFQGDGKESLTGCGNKDRWEYNYNACMVFGDKLAYLHSNKLKKAFETGLEQAKKDSFFQYKGNTNYLKEVNWLRYQTGDGLADYYLSLNACQKGLTLKKDPAVKSCVSFSDMNHLATAGGNTIALVDIIKQLSE